MNGQEDIDWQERAKKLQLRLANHDSELHVSIIAETLWKASREGFDLGREEERYRLISPVELGPP